ncbi:SpvB/TcaC N-terminal domain-containing protein [Nonomuraea sp. NPDC050202]|uniref:SpvB/TcaC N-terminal domain-containing protein n=1 Tax=Nonomuraea sp. NPDC050202 TaxID=3155035 RepID=UPI0033FEB6FE
MLGLRRGSPKVAAILAIVVPATLAAPIAAQATRDDPAWHKSQEQHPVPGHAAGARGPLADPGAGFDLKEPPAVTWPEPGTAVVTQAARSEASASAADGGRSATVRAGRLPVYLGTSAGKAPSVQIRTLDVATARRAGIAGLGIELTPQAASRAAVEVDYSGFRYAYGGDWASRLRLVKLPGCAATTPERPECQTRTPLPSRNDVKAGRVSADVDLAADTTMLAAEAAPSGPAGSYETTSLSPSATWSVSNQTGAFSWSYPLRLPPGPGGPTPNLAFAYSSGSIDGRTVATNNQASWIGEGFDYWPGFIERRYKACTDDGVTPKRNDQCWGNHNATLSLNGQATELILDDATNTWQPKEDDGSKIEKLTGAENGDNDGEYWRVTTPDGTQYYFGRNRLPGWADGQAETQSTWTSPVFGDDDGEPCHEDSFSDSWCQQAWRWNLDYVVDPHGTVSTFWYAQESNHYRRDVTTLTDGVPNGTPTRYDRGGYLKRIDYGQRSAAIFSSSAPVRVVFDVKERCIPTADFDCAADKLTKDNAKHWPDVPFDQNCDAGEKSATCSDGEGQSSVGGDRPRPGQAGRVPPRRGRAARERSGGHCGAGRETFAQVASIREQPVQADQQLDGRLRPPPHGGVGADSGQIPVFGIYSGVRAGSGAGRQGVAWAEGCRRTKCDTEDRESATVGETANIPGCGGSSRQASLRSSTN